MKELTIEQKAKAYDEAIARARQFSEHPLLEDSSKIVEYIFPELKDNKDDDVKLTIIQFLKYASSYGCPDILSKEKAETWIAWLEKQGKKSQGKTALEAIKEEKVDTANKIEPKFKVGNWIVSNVKKDVFYIKSAAQEYLTLEDTEGNIYSPCLPPTESDYHLWTIQDAKDGDVLVASDGSVFIYAGSTDIHAKFYVALTECSRLNVEGGVWEDKNSVHPATKEQCNLLFQKMNEAGYNWMLIRKS